MILEDLVDLAPHDLVPDWCIVGDSAMHYIPLDFQEKMTVSFYKAYILVIEAMHQVLMREAADASCIPTADAITAQLESSDADATAYFDAGGKMTFVLEALVDRAYEKSPEGPEHRRKPDLQEEEREFELQTEELPRCVHDLDFTLVRTKLGLPAQGTGPHWFFLTDDEDSDTSSSEDEEEAVYVGLQSDAVVAAGTSNTHPMVTALKWIFVEPSN